jgi:hypothetical protein
VHTDPERYRDKIIEVIGQKTYDSLKAKALMSLKVSAEDLKLTKILLERELKLSSAVDIERR